MVKKVARGFAVSGAGGTASQRRGRRVAASVHGPCWCRREGARVAKLGAQGGPGRKVGDAYILGARSIFNCWGEGVLSTFQGNLSGMVCRLSLTYPLRGAIIGEGNKRRIYDLGSSFCDLGRSGAGRV